MRAASSSSNGSLSDACFSTQIAYGDAIVTIARIKAQRVFSNAYALIALYIGTARNAAGMKYVKSAQLSTARPPRAFRRLIENAAVAAMPSVIAPTATAITSELPNCRQK